MIHDGMIAEAERVVKKKAAEIAFKRSNDLDNSELQSILFKLYKDCIILGARLMQEELMNLSIQEHETEGSTHTKSHR